MTAGIRKAVSRYAFAAAAAGAALKLMEVPLVRQGGGNGTLIAAIAVLLAAWAGGRGPGLFATAVIGAFASHAEFTDWRILRHSLFFAFAVLTSLLVGSLHAARRRAEEEAERRRASESRFRRLSEAGVVGVIVVAPDGAVVEANDEFLRAVGYTRDDLEGGRVDWAAMTPPEYREQDRRKLLELERAGACTPFVKEYVRKDGLRVAVIVAVARLEGAGPRYVAAVLDVSARRRAEEGLRLLAEAGEAFGASLDTDDALQALAELSVPRLAAHCAVDRVGPDGPPRRVADFPPGGEPVAPAAAAPTRPELVRDGSSMRVPLSARGRALGAVTFTAAPDRRYDGEDLALAEELARRAAVAVDNVRLYREAHQARREAEAASLAKDRFLAALSHELRTPLTPVLVGVTALLDDPEMPESVRPTLEVTRRNVALEARLIDDLLDVTRIAQGKLRLHPSVVDAHGLIRQAVEICRDETAAAGVALVQELEAPARHVEGDPARVQQILWNLVKNAGKFTPPGGRVVVRTRNAPGPPGGPPWLVVEVTDTGIGIGPDVLPRIFNAFEQGDPSVTLQFGGLGLGLAISRSLAEAHGGRLTASSDGPGHGSTFTLELPAAPPPAEPGPAAAAGGAAAAGPAGPLRILLAEDNADTLRVMARLLRHRGHRVETAENVEAALRVDAESGPFDLVVSDIGLPDGSGLDLMRRLRARRPVPGIALSGFGTDDDRERSRDAGFVAHLTKPVEFAALEDAIRLAAAAAPPTPPPPLNGPPADPAPAPTVNAQEPQG